MGKEEESPQSDHGFPQVRVTLTHPRNGSIRAAKVSWRSGTIVRPTAHTHTPLLSPPSAERVQGLATPSRMWLAQPEGSSPLGPGACSEGGHTDSPTLPCGC